MELRFLDAGDRLRDEVVALRHRVLRDPLGLPKDAVRFAFEDVSLHLCALQDGAVVGCVLFHPARAGEGRLYQMAVAPEHQRRGVGRSLVLALHARLREEGVRRVYLHARADAVEFYRRLGYIPEGEPFVEVGITHQAMGIVLGGTA